MLSSQVIAIANSNLTDKCEVKYFCIILNMQVELKNLGETPDVVYVVSLTNAGINQNS